MPNPERTELEGKKDKLKGEVKDTYGDITNDRSVQAEGKWDKAKGEVKEKVGELGRKHEER